MNMNGFSGRLSSDPATDGTAGKGMFRRQWYAVTAQTRRFGSKVTVNGWINEMVCAINPKSVIRPQRENPNIGHGFCSAPFATPQCWNLHELLSKVVRNPVINRIYGEWLE